MTAGLINGLVVAVVATGAAILLFLPGYMRSDGWRATVTPLASIIGSGFLILGPLLTRTYGHMAVGVMALLCIVAFGFGSAIRFNILELDRRGAAELPGPIAALDATASWALAFAYIVSVAYYLRLFGSFAVSLTSVEDAFHAKLVTTAVLAFVGLYGYARGLRALEGLERVSVGVKLAIIAGLLAGLALYAVELASAGTLPTNGTPPITWGSLTVGLGLLVTVQGFETSRYLGAAYDARMRVRTMRRAQYIASAIYVVYILLVALAFPAEKVDVSETAIIKIAAVVAPILPALLIAAALASQFSAAVADTSGGGGLAEELSRAGLPSRVAYLLIAIVAIALVWAADVFQIIAFASRAFAVYYALQSTLAACLAWRRPGGRRPGLAAFHGAFALFALVIAVFGAPVE
ncbi:MAG: hypothetical protein RLT05_07370 [Bauldia litoralis]